MSDCSKEEVLTEDVADNWEEAGDEVSAQIDQRQKMILLKKRRDEELAKAREAAQQLTVRQACSFNDEKATTAFKILRRPQSCDKFPSSSNQAIGGDTSKKLLSYQEREAAYLQARERIFGGNYNPEDELASENELLTSMIPLTSNTQSSVNVVQARAVYGVPGRARAPNPIRTPRVPLFQPSPVGQGVTFTMAPPIGVYPPMMQSQPQQRVTMMNVTQHKSPQQIIYYDSRFPPPSTTVYPVSMPNNMLPITYSNSNNRNNPVPYGRPPTQLLAQNQFTASSSNSSSKSNF